MTNVAVLGYEQGHRSPRLDLLGVFHAAGLDPVYIATGYRMRPSDLDSVCKALAEEAPPRQLAGDDPDEDRSG